MSSKQVLRLFGTIRDTVPCSLCTKWTDRTTKCMTAALTLSSVCPFGLSFERHQAIF